jgi:hypothetical protein
MFVMYFVHNFLTNVINIEVHCFGYLYTMDMINAWKMDNVETQQQTNSHWFVIVTGG